MRRRVLVGLAAGLLLASQAALADKAARAQARHAFQHDLVSLLALRAEALPLTGAALLARTAGNDPGPLGFHRLITRAAAAPDAGPAQNWLRLADCDARAGTCPDSDALRALERDDPDNAAVWMLRLGQAASRDDGAAADSALARAAQASRYDDYTGRSLQALADAVALLPPPASTLSATGDRATRVAALQVAITFGIGDAQPRPVFAQVAATCRPQRVSDHPERLTACLRLARVLVWGSAPLARALGLHLLATLGSSASQRTRAEADMRDLAWQVRQFAQLQDRARTNRAVAQRLLMLARRGGTEMAQMLAALRAFNIPAQAPDVAPPTGQAHAADLPKGPH